MKKTRTLSVLLAVILSLGLLGACSASMSESPAYDAVSPAETRASTTAAGPAKYGEAEMQGGGMAPAAPPAATEAPNEGGFVPDAARKIIRNASLSIETLVFDDSITALKALVGKYSGYIQNSSESGISAVSRRDQSRYATFTLRIPSESLDAFLSGAGEVGNILNLSTSGEEITEQYYDTEARLSSLKTQEERLLAILEKAEELKDVVELEKALSDVRYQIETLTSTLRRYDSLVAYSTVNVELREVANLQTVAPLPQTLSERIGQRFAQTTKNLKEDAFSFIVWLIGDLPLILVNLAVFAAILFVIVFVLKRLGVVKKRDGALPPAEKKPEDQEKK